MAPAERRRGRKPWTLDLQSGRGHLALNFLKQQAITISTRQRRHSHWFPRTVVGPCDPSHPPSDKSRCPCRHSSTFSPSPLSRPLRPETTCLPDHTRLTFRQGNHVAAGWRAIRTPFRAQPSAARRHRQPARVWSIRLGADSTRAVAARVQLAPHASTHTLQGIVRRLGA